MVERRGVAGRSTMDRPRSTMARQRLGTGWFIACETGCLPALRFQALGQPLSADPADRPAAGAASVRSVRRLCLQPGSAGLRPVAAVRRLADGPRTLDQLGAQLSLPPDATARLLEAAVALRLVERRPTDGSVSACWAPRCGQSRRRGDDRASSAAVRRSARSGCTAARRAGNTALGRLWPYADGAAPAAAGARRSPPTAR